MRYADFVRMKTATYISKTTSAKEGLSGGSSGGGGAEPRLIAHAHKTFFAPVVVGGKNPPHFLLPLPFGLGRPQAGYRVLWLDKHLNNTSMP